MQRNNTRRESRNIAGRFRGGKLAPVMAVPFLGGEGGMLNQTITLELDPVAGRLITPVTAEMISIFVPVQAIDAIQAPDAEYAGLTEVLRQKLLTGNPLFGTEAENEISKRLGVVPASVAGVKVVNKAARLAHNAAVNFLRKRKYTYAAQILHTNGIVTPALIGRTVLDRFNAALDPDDHINGAVQLSIPNMNLPVSGIGVKVGNNNITPNSSAYWSHGSPSAPTTVANAREGQDVAMAVNATGVPQVFAALNGIAAGGVSLSDFYNAQKMDELTRTMRDITDKNPLDGEDMVLRWAHGLSVDPGRHPFILFEGERTFGQTYREATDGTGLMDETSLSKMALQMSFTVPVPTTELGGIVITFATVKPDETIADQPHPILSRPWTSINQVAEELQLDPQPVLMREVNAAVAQASETTVAFYTGHNELKKAYVNYGFNRHLDLETVDAKTAIWQLDIPASVTPQSVVYPAELSHYPFLDQAAEVATYAIRSEAVIRTPTFFGPSPVETVSVIDDADLFDEV